MQTMKLPFNIGQKTMDKQSAHELNNNKYRMIRIIINT